MSDVDNDLVVDDVEEKADDNVQLDLYDINKGLLKRDGGPYLDQVERERDEVIRAAKEKREPDLSNPPANAGTVLVPKHYLRETDASNAHNSAAADLENEPEASVFVDTSDPFKGEPDSKQVDWDNDGSKVNALSQKQAYESTEAAEYKEPEPVSADAPSQPDASSNNDDVVTGLGTSVWTDSAPSSSSASDEWK